MVVGGLIEKIPGGNNQNKQFHWWVELGRKLSVFRISHGAASSGEVFSGGLDCGFSQGGRRGACDMK